MHELERRSVGLHPKHPGTEALLLAANFSIEGRVTDRAPDPVVESVAQIRRTGVRVARAPPRRQHLAHVRLVVAVGVFQKQEVGRVSDDDSAARESDRGRDIQAFGEHRHLVALAVAVGVFEDFDFVITDPVGRHLVRVIDRLGNPQAAALVPGEADRVDDVRLAGEQLQAEAHRCLGVVHAVLRLERELVRQRLGALLVVGDVAALLIFERRAGSDEFSI